MRRPASTSVRFESAASRGEAVRGKVSYTHEEPVSALVTLTDDLPRRPARLASLAQPARHTGCVFRVRILVAARRHHGHLRRRVRHSQTTGGLSLPLVEVAMRAL